MKFEDILKDLDLTEIVERSSFDYSKLEEAGLNPRNYVASEHYYLPFLCYVESNGQGTEFLSLIKGHEELFSSYLKPFTKEWLKDRIDLFNRSYGNRKEAVKASILLFRSLCEKVSEEDYLHLKQVAEKGIESKQQELLDIQSLTKGVANV